VRSGLEPTDLEAQVRHLMDPAAAQKTLHWGRNYLYLSRFEGADGPGLAVVKQFRHQRWKARWRRKLSGSKAEKSFRVAAALLEAGIRTPEPLLAIESDADDGPAFYACRYLPDALEARYLFRAANAGTEAEQFPEIDFAAFLDALGALVQRLHAAGFWHRDLSAGNVLLQFPAGREAGKPPDLYLVDLNRTRFGRPLSDSERTRDLSRLTLFRPEHRERLLESYWRGQGGVTAARRALYGTYQGAFVQKNETKKRLRSGTAKLRQLFLPRVAHTHIPAAPEGASARDRVVWDVLSDQPHQHASRWAKLRVRAADLGDHAGEAATVARALPRIWRRYGELKRELHSRPVAWPGAGVCLRPGAEPAEELLALVDDLGARQLLVRLHPWDDDHGAEEELARELAARGCELTFALPQNRQLVKDSARWRRQMDEIAARFTPYGRRFQVGQAINRSKWGIWSVSEYVTLARAAAEAFAPYPGVELIGPSVIDFEYHVTAAVLNLPGLGLRFDGVSALLYVDRRGAPENRQAGLDTEGKVALLKAIADTARNAAGKLYLTEVNWPLREGPHSPAGRAVSVGEEEQADYLVRYYLAALGTGLVERVFWWQIVAKGYGLVDPGEGGRALRRRASFFALKTLAAQLDGSTLEAVLPVAAPARLYLFRRADGTRVAVGWSTGAPAAIELPAPAAAVVGRGGEELSLSNGAGTPAVTVTSAPRYFRLA
jgi:tRNA A-37 threonylcarbamoyl transferase component Bud32